MKTPIVSAIKLYQRWVSPALPGSCRFFPSCSEYGREAVERHGSWAGLGLIVWRLLRCHPFHPGGYDPVPERTETGCRGDGVSGTSFVQHN